MKEFQINKFGSAKSGSIRVEDLLCIESPLEIKARKASHALFSSLVVMMRTPGQDLALIAGFLYSEGIITSASQIINISIIKDREAHIILTNDTNLDLQSRNRNIYSSSSCGVCSKASIDDLSIDSPYLSYMSTLSISAKKVYNIGSVLKEKSYIFNKTGGNHAIALLSSKAELIEIFEDIGRHNAMDKLIGHCLTNKLLPLHQNMILVSGRLGYELVQKAAMTGIPIILALGAPSSIAVEEASAQNICIAGFVKEKGFNVYSAQERITKNYD